MDCRRALAAFLSLSAAAATASDSLPLREARWIVPEARLEMLTSDTRYCTDRAATSLPGNALYGLAAFRDPLLLGGQAARAGLSCASCHRGGRGNAAFVFPGVSGTPGTADVTSSLLSRHRGDSLFNPKPIPDLTHDPPAISRTEPGRLEAFIESLIVEEFDGAEPPGRIVSGLADAVRAFDRGKCDASAATAFEADMANHGYAVAGAQAALDSQDRETAIAMLRAVRSAIGIVAERYPATMVKPFADADEKIAGIQQSLREGQALADAKAAIDGYAAQAEWTKVATGRRHLSLYNPDRLAAALSAPRTP